MKSEKKSPPDRRDTDGFPELSQREMEVVRFIQEGKTGHQIIMMLAIKPNTVKSHVSKILRKLGAGNLILATMKASDVKCWK